MLYDVRDASINDMRALLLLRLLSVDVNLLTEHISLENDRGTALSLELVNFSAGLNRFTHVLAETIPPPVCSRLYLIRIAQRYIQSINKAFEPL